MDTSGNNSNAHEHKYNTRYKGKMVKYNMKPELKSESESEEDEDYDSSEESDKDINLDQQEYQKFLNEIFPSEYQKQKLNNLKKNENPTCNIIIAKSNFINKKSYLNNKEKGAGIGSTDEEADLDYEDENNEYVNPFKIIVEPNEKEKEILKINKKKKRYGN